RDLLLQRGDRGGNALRCLDVAVVERDALDGTDLQRRAGRHQPGCSAQQCGVEGGLSQAAGQTKDAHLAEPRRRWNQAGRFILKTLSGVTSMYTSVPP